MKINEHNYQAYFLDYVEGNLSQHDKVDLFLFLKNNPHYKTELDEFETIFVKPDTEAVFAEKNSIKKSKNETTDQLLIGYIENTLSEQERKEVEKQITKNTQLGKELELFKKTIVAPDASVIYPNKSSLKKKPKLIWFNSFIEYAMAASVFLLLGLFFVYKTNKKISEETNNSKVTNNQITNDTLSIKTNSPIQQQDSINIQEITIANNSAEHQSPPKNHETKLPSTHLVTFHPNPNDSLPKQKLIVNTPTPKLVTNTLAIKDSVPKTTALSFTKVVNTIVETVEEEVENSIEKKETTSIWSIARKALNSLNKAGVKQVNGAEKEAKQTVAYSFNIGGLEIKKTQHKQNL